MFDHLQSILNANSLFENFQSDFKAGHSTDSTLPRVLNYSYLATDSGDPVVLILLNLSAAFDMVDHCSLTTTLES